MKPLVGAILRKICKWAAKLHTACADRWIGWAEKFDRWTR